MLPQSKIVPQGGVAGQRPALPALGTKGLRGGAVLRMSPLPRLLLGLNLPDDAFHPGEEVSGHAEEAEFVCRVYQLGAAASTGFKQRLPGGGHFLFLVLDGLCFLPSICLLQAAGHILELLDLWLGKTERRSPERCALGLCWARGLSPLGLPPQVSSGRQDLQLSTNAGGEVSLFWPLWT